MVGNHKCHVYTEDEKRAFYDANQDLFTRYHGDLFSYEEVDLIIEKWLKVQEYPDTSPESDTAHQKPLFHFSMHPHSSIPFLHAADPQSAQRHIRAKW